MKNNIFHIHDYKRVSSAGRPDYWQCTDRECADQVDETIAADYASDIRKDVEEAFQTGN